MGELAKVVAAWDRLVSVLRPHLAVIFVVEGLVIQVYALTVVPDWIFWPLMLLDVVAWMAWVYLAD